MKLFNHCPICGSVIEYNSLMQYSNVYKVLKNGNLSKKRIRREDVGSMECGFYSCTNSNCDFVTDCELHVINYSEIKLHLKGGKIYYTIDTEIDR